MRHRLKCFAVFLVGLSIALVGFADSASASIPVTNQFATQNNQDMRGATDGNYIVQQDSTGHLQVLSMTGSVVSSVSTFGSIFCPTGTPLTLCAHGFDVDDRIAYDAGAQRWILTALWDGSQTPIPWNVMAVSKTNDPKGAWWVYQFPACGASYGATDSDQPHLGFNSQWIVIRSRCDLTSGTGIAVFNKSVVYAGQALTLNTNYWEFSDAVENAGLGFSDPAMTYVSTPNNVEYLATAAYSSAGKAETIYSTIDGPVNAPVYHGNLYTVVTPYSAGNAVNTDLPSCQSCLGAPTLNLVHSSGAWNINGTPYAVSTFVMSDPTQARSNMVVNVAFNMNTHTSIVNAIKGTAAGFGAIASEISMPAVPVSGHNLAVVGYLFSSSSMKPSLMAATWDLDSNTFDTPTIVKQGTVAVDPSSDDGKRWVDFVDALVPVPGTSSVVIGGLVAIGSSSDSQRSGTWATLPVVSTPTINGPTYATVSDSPSGAGVVISTTINTANRSVGAYVVYGPTTSYGGYSPTVPLSTSNAPTSTQLYPWDKLSASYPTMHYQIHVTQAGLPDIIGPDLVASFGIANVSASAPSGYGSTVTVTANINPYSVNSNAMVFYGPTPSYGGYVNPISIGSGTTPYPYSQQPHDTINPGSTLYYQIKVMQDNGNIEYSQGYSITGH